MMWSLINKLLSFLFSRAAQQEYHPAVPPSAPLTFQATAAAFNTNIMQKAAKTIEWISPPSASPEARVLLLAIAGQESGWQYRKQVGGPAHGFWQCEQGGGVRGVLINPATRETITKVCQALNVQPTEEAVYAAIIDNDALAYAVARCILLADPQPLPKLGDQHAAWECYERNWRPGKPRPETWDDRYQQALSVLEVA